MRLQTLEHVQSHAWSTKTTQEFDHIHQDGFLWLVVISLLKRLAITCDYSTLSVVYEAPSKWIKFVWHEIELLSFFWRDRPYRFKVFGTIRTIPNLHHVEISYGFLPKCVFPKKIASYVLMGKNDALGWQGPPPCTWWKARDLCNQDGPGCPSWMWCTWKLSCFFGAYRFTVFRACLGSFSIPPY